MPSKRRSSGICLFLIIIIVIGLWWLNFNPDSNLNLPYQMHGQLTGQDATVDSTIFGVGGTDLGIIVKHGTEFFYFFGDTFSSTDSMTGNWRSNTLAISNDTIPSDGISLDDWIVDPTTGLAKELISSLKIDNIEMTCIPTAAISLNGILYVYYMSVRHWSSTGGMWTCNNASIAVSVDDGQNFSKMTNISWDGDSNFVLFSAAQPYDESDEYLYLLSTPSGRFGACYLSRVDPLQILDKSAYRYFSGLSSTNDTMWSTETSDAVPIFPSPVGEVSVMWNDYLNKWTAFYLDSMTFSIDLRTADNLWGTWSDPITIVSGSEYPSLYGSYVHPEFVEDNGEVVYFIMSIFSQYNTFVMSVNVSSLVT
ncbi:DUF4185 domain-containing protein [Candidatus Thorarchaeota archaeon]|nr:MAG: DUF4185 domain-containing protein [Candidatus Thorarchaeota archaeon]